MNPLSRSRSHRYAATSATGSWKTLQMSCSTFSTSLPSGGDMMLRCSLLLRGELPLSSPSPWLSPSSSPSGTGGGAPSVGVARPVACVGMELRRPELPRPELPSPGVLEPTGPRCARERPMDLKLVTGLAPLLPSICMAAVPAVEPTVGDPMPVCMLLEDDIMLSLLPMLGIMALLPLGGAMLLLPAMAGTAPPPVPVPPVAVVAGPTPLLLAPMLWPLLPSVGGWPSLPSICFGLLDAFDDVWDLARFASARVDKERISQSMNASPEFAVIF
mgnify:CR=1 FL=1